MDGKETRSREEERVRTKEEAAQHREEERVRPEEEESQPRLLPCREEDTTFGGIACKCLAETLLLPSS